MAQLWKSSRWLRHYDWDWETAPWPDVEHRIAEYRSRILPRKFIYHVLAVARRQTDLDPDAPPQDLALQFLEYQDQLAELIEAFREPMPVGAMLQPPLRDRLGGAQPAFLPRPRSRRTRRRYSSPPTYSMASSRPRRRWSPRWKSYGSMSPGR